MKVEPWMVNKAIETARQELEAEAFRLAVEEAKTYLRTRRPWWQVLFPFKITISRR